MRENPDYALAGPRAAKDLIRSHPWATMASATPDGVVVSHYPFLLEESAGSGDEIVLVSHVGRPDERLHRLGESELCVVFYGPSGYISPSWSGSSPIRSPTTTRPRPRRCSRPSTSSTAPTGCRGCR